MNFTLQEFATQYKNLCSSESKESRDQANQYIYQFQYSQEAWHISQMLIQNENGNQDLQFLGCSIIYKKTLSEFSIITEQDKEELKCFALNILLNNNIQLIKQAYKQLCSCIGVLALVTCTSTWGNCIDQIINLMQQPPIDKFIYYGLEILETIGKDIQNLVIERKQLSKIQKFFKSPEQSKKIYQIFNSLLNYNNEQIVLKTFQVIIEFADEGFKFQILQDIGLIDNLLSLMPKNLEFFDKISEILEIAFKNSEGSCILQVQSISQKIIDQKELQNLEKIISMLQIFSQEFQQQINNKKNTGFCKSFSHILNNFCLNYMQFLLQKDQTSINLINQLLMGASHVSKRISLFTLEVIQQIYNDTASYIKIPEYSYLAQSFEQLFYIVIEKSKYPEPDYKLKLQEEPDDEEGETSIYTFRQVSKDLLSNIFKIFKQKGQVGLTTYFQGVISQFNNNNLQQKQYEINVENGLFMVNCLTEDQDFLNECKIFIAEIYKFVYSKQFPINSEFCVREALDCIIYLRDSLIENTELFNETIKFVLQFLNQKPLQTTCCVSFCAIIEAIGEHSDYQTLEFSFKTIIQVIDQIKDSISIQNLIQGLLNFTLKIQNQELKINGFMQLLETIQQKIQVLVVSIKSQNTINQNIEIIKIILEKILDIFIGLYKGFDIIEVKRLNLVDALITQFSTYNINLIWELYSNLGNLDLQNFSLLLKYILKKEKHKIQYQNILNTSLKHFQNNVKQNSFCLEILEIMFDNLKPSQPEFDQWLSSNFAAFNQFVFENLKNLQCDPDLVREYMRVLNKCAEYNVNLLFQLELFIPIMSLIMTNGMLSYRESETQKQILTFFYQLIKNTQSNSQQKLQELIPNLIQTLIIAVPDIDGIIIQQISAIFIGILKNYESFKTNIQNFIYQGLLNQKYQVIPDSYKKLISQGIITKDNDIRFLKLTLGDLASTINKKMDAQEAEFSLQIRLQNSQQKPNLI